MATFQTESGRLFPRIFRRQLAEAVHARIPCSCMCAFSGVDHQFASPGLAHFLRCTTLLISFIFLVGSKCQVGRASQQVESEETV